MKILLTIDGSSYSEMSVQTLKGLKLSSQSEIMAMTVVPEHTFLGGLRLDMFRGGGKAKELAHKAQEQEANKLLEGAIKKLQRKGLKIETLVRWGKTAEQIVNTAHELKADLVVVGAKGADTSPLYPYGSTAQKVMKHAGCSVLMIREGASDIKRVLLATDGSEHADEATNFILDLHLSPSVSIIIITALHSYVTSYLKMPTLDLKTNQDILADLQSAEEEAAQDLLEFTKKKFRERHSEVLTVVLRGDPTQEILGAAERFNPDLIVLGAKGLNRIEKFMLGSVAQRVAKYARCSVLIVRPKRK